MLPLQGFWNAVVYVVASRSAVRALFEGRAAGFLGRGRRRGGARAGVVGMVGIGRGMGMGMEGKGGVEGERKGRRGSEGESVVELTPVSRPHPHLHDQQQLQHRDRDRLEDGDDDDDDDDEQGRC